MKTAHAWQKRERELPNIVKELQGKVKVLENVVEALGGDIESLKATAVRKEIAEKSEVRNEQ